MTKSASASALIGPNVIRIMLSGRFLSTAVSNILAVIISIRLLEITNSAFLVGLVVALRMGGSAVGALISAKALARWGLPKLLLSTDIGAALMLIIVFILPAAVEVISLLAASFILGATFGISNITMLSVGPELVGTKDRHHLNGKIQSVQALAVVCSGLLTGLLYSSGQISLTFALAAVAFLAAGLLTSIRAPILPEGAQAAPAKTGRKSIRSVLLAGLPLVFVLLIMSRVAEALGSGVHNVGFPILSADFNPQNQAILAGWLLSAWGAGKILAGFIVPALLKRYDSSVNRIANAFMFFNIMTFVFFLAIFQVDTLWGYLLFAVLAGIFDAATEISYYSCLQSTERSLRERLLSVSYIVERLALFTGILGAGVVLDQLALKDAALFIYLATILFVVLVWAGHAAAVRRNLKAASSETVHEG